jgi:hypothetical protein
MDQQRIIQNVCQLPHEMRKTGNKSPAQILRESGCSDYPEVLNSSVIETFLHTHVDLVEEWIAYSADKRTSEGWYIIRQGSGRETKYIVGFHPNGHSFEFSQPDKACGEFIVREVMEILSNAA